jgi:hypothetical protein
VRTQGAEDFKFEIYNFKFQIWLWRSFRRQSAHNFVCNRISPRCDLLWRLVLDGVGNVDGIEACATQRAGLDPGRSHEFSCRYRDGGDAQIL